MSVPSQYQCIITASDITTTHTHPLILMVLIPTGAMMKDYLNVTRSPGDRLTFRAFRFAPIPLQHHYSSKQAVFKQCESEEGSRQWGGRYQKHVNKYCEPPRGQKTDLMHLKKKDID